MQQLQKQLNKQAQILGDLNLQLNKYIQQNQKLSLDISKLQQKIIKKKKQIDQQDKDKIIIYQKLNQSQQIKNKLEIQIGDQKKFQNQEDTQKVQQEIKRPQFLNNTVKQQKDNIKNDDKNNEPDQNSGYMPPIFPIQQRKVNKQQVQNEDGSDQQHDGQKLLQSVRQKLKIMSNQDNEDQGGN